MFKEEQQAISQVKQLINATSAKYELIELFLQLDTYTRFHCYRVKEIVQTIGNFLNLQERQLEGILLTAFLHDIGKVAIPQKLLNKTAQLSEQELQHVRMHAKIGADMCEVFQLSSHLIDAIRCHHEYFNGAGYPFGLSASAIPLASRIISVADALDVMLSGRRYSKPRTLAEAVNSMICNSGSQFDPILVNSLLITIGERKTGALKTCSEID